MGVHLHADMLGLYGVLQLVVLPLLPPGGSDDAQSLPRSAGREVRDKLGLVLGLIHTDTLGS